VAEPQDRQDPPVRPGIGDREGEGRGHGRDRWSELGETEEQNGEDSRRESGRVELPRALCAAPAAWVRWPRGRPLARRGAQRVAISEASASCVAISEASASCMADFANGRGLIAAQRVPAPAGRSATLATHACGRGWSPAVPTRTGCWPAKVEPGRVIASEIEASIISVNLV
jgi:hypothetical protein